MPKSQTHESWTSRAAYIIVAISATVGLGNLWRFPFAAGENGGGVFVLINGLVGNILLPITGILISLFAGWVIPKGISIDELGLGKKIYFNIWLVVVRFVAPAGVLALLLTNLFLARG